MYLLLVVAVVISDLYLSSLSALIWRLSDRIYLITFHFPHVTYLEIYILRRGYLCSCVRL